jgi:hypothetical protein
MLLRNDTLLHLIVTGKGLFMSRSPLRRLRVSGLVAVSAILALPLRAAQAHAAMCPQPLLPIRSSPARPRPLRSPPPIV